VVVFVVVIVVMRGAQQLREQLPRRPDVPLQQQPAPIVQELQRLGSNLRVRHARHRHVHRAQFRSNRLRFALARTQRRDQRVRGIASGNRRLQAALPLLGRLRVTAQQQAQDIAAALGALERATAISRARRA
jgi:hypothetical protein